MAISFMILRTSHTVVPHAIRAVVTSNILTGYYHVTKAVARDHQEHRLVRQSGQYFSTAAAAPQKLADQETIKFIKSEIKSIKAKPDIIQMPKVPENFPFEIRDTPSDKSIILTRELAGEKIEVQVGGPYRIECSDDDDDDSSTNTSDDSDEDSDYKSLDTSEKEEEFDCYETYIWLSVEIFKENGEILKADASTDNDGSISVHSISLDKYNSNCCLNCWTKKDLLNTWRNYLARRGVEDGIVDFLMEYMTKKSKRDHLLFMKNLKKFVKD